MASPHRNPAIQEGLTYHLDQLFFECGPWRPKIVDNTTDELRDRTGVTSQGFRSLWKSFVQARNLPVSKRPVSTPGAETFDSVRPSKKSRRARPSIEVKRQICQFKASRPNMTQKLIAEKFNLNPATVGAVLKDKDRYLNADIGDKTFSKAVGLLSKRAKVSKRKTSDAQEELPQTKKHRNHNSSLTTRSPVDILTSQHDIRHFLSGKMSNSDRSERC